MKAKADVAVNTQAAGGSVNGVEGLETAGTLLQELESLSAPTSRPPSVISVSIPMGLEVVEQMGSEKAPSMVSTNSNASQATIGKDVVLAANKATGSGRCRLPALY